MSKYSKKDVEALAMFVLAHNSEYDNSGSINRDGLRYCVDCNVYETYDNGCSQGVKHKHTCITKVAQDVLTTGAGT